MNRRLPGPTAFVLRFSRRPLERPQRFIQQSDFMILRNHVIQRRLKEGPLLPDQHRLRPLIRRPHRIQLPRPASISASIPRIARPRLDIQGKSRDLRITSSVPKGRWGLFIACEVDQFRKLLFANAQGLTSGRINNAVSRVTLFDAERRCQSLRSSVVVLQLARSR
jgi:hypothetical protein